MTKSVFTNRYRHLRLLIAQQRKTLGITQQQLAKLLGRPQSFVSKFESGERRLDVVEFIDVAEVLRLNPGEVVNAVQEIPKEGRKSGGK